MQGPDHIWICCRPPKAAHFFCCLLSTQCAAARRRGRPADDCARARGHQNADLERPRGRCALFRPAARALGTAPALEAARSIISRCQGCVSSDTQWPAGAYFRPKNSRTPAKSCDLLISLAKFKVGICLGRAKVHLGSNPATWPTIINQRARARESRIRRDANSNRLSCVCVCVWRPA